MVARESRVDSTHTSPEHDPDALRPDDSMALADTRDVRNPWLGLGVFLLIVGAVAAIGGVFEPGQWYAELTKPSWTPPSWLFGPVWAVLYVAMAFSGWLVWKGAGGMRGGLVLFGLQLALNGLWSFLFFGQQRIDLALIDIVALDVAVAATALAFWYHRRLASILLWPYLGWLLFATALNVRLYQLN